MEMTSIMEATLVIIALLLALLFCLDIFLIIILNRRGRKKNKDAAYFELKYRIDLVRNLGIGVALIFGFFGYSTYEDFRKPLKPLQDSVAALRQQVETIAKEIHPVLFISDSSFQIENPRKTYIYDGADSATWKLPIGTDAIAGIRTAIINLSPNQSRLTVVEPMKLSTVTTMFSGVSKEFIWTGRQWRAL